MRLPKCKFQSVVILRDLFLDEYIILQPDWINNMDHVHISGIEPWSVILNQTKHCKSLKCYVQIMPKQAEEAKRDGVITH